MLNKTLWLTVGLPGSGKSTKVKEMFPNGRIISRDEIRFSLLGDNDDYFAKEKQVWDIFINSIQLALHATNYEDIIADATHLTEKSRHKVLNILNLNDIKVNAIYMDVPTKECFRRNAKRTGIARVPDSVIYDMSLRLTNPQKDTRNHFDSIYIIDKNNEIKINSLA